MNRGDLSEPVRDEWLWDRALPDMNPGKIEATQANLTQEEHRGEEGAGSITPFLRRATPLKRSRSCAGSWSASA